jgi:hypothetical protein
MLTRPVPPRLSGWWLPPLAAVAAAAAAALWIRLAEPAFTAVLVVGPTAATGAGATGAQAALWREDGGSPVVAFGEAGQAVSDFTRFVEILATLEVAERALADDPSILRGAFRGAWDARAGSWRPPTDAASRAARLLDAALGRPAWTPPDAGDLARHLRDRLETTQVGTTALRRVRYRHPDRDHAVRLLGALVRAADGRLRERALARSEALAGHLRDRLARTAVAEHRRALAELLAEHERRLIALSVDLPFAADVVEGPVADSRPDWPDPRIVLPVAALAGFAAGLAWIRLRPAPRPTAEPAP